jgi:glutathione S-transferase
MEALAALRLIVHPMCPYSQRALIAWSFKNVPGEISVIDLVNKPEWYLQINPEGKVPSLTVERNGTIFKLFESTLIAEFIDSLPGPNLYPQLNGKTDPIAKCLIDVYIKTKIDNLFSSLLPLMYGPNEEVRLKGIQNLRELNERLNGVSFVMDKELQKGQVTFADVVLLPAIERLNSLRDQWALATEVNGLSNVWSWYDRMTSFEWVRQNLVPPHRLVNLYARNVGGDRGLKLPLTRYDEEFKP